MRAVAAHEQIARWLWGKPPHTYSSSTPLTIVLLSLITEYLPREDRGGPGGGGQDGPVGAGGPDVPVGAEAPPSAERRKLKLVPRTKPAGQAAAGAAAPAPASTKKSSIFGGGKAHDEFAYEVCCLCVNLKIVLCWFWLETRTK